MDDLPQLIAYLLAFGFIAMAAERIGGWFRSVHLPLITGFLIAGVVAGPSVLGLIQADALPRLRFVDEVALAFIAFAAGGELYLRELRGKLGGIASITTGLVVSTLLLGTATVLWLGDMVPFLQDLSPARRWGPALLAGAILVARSPSSAIAVVKELRARGPFTRVTLGVTVIMDVAVIVLFAGAMAVADALLTDVPLDPGFAVLLLSELAASLLVGAAAWVAITLVLARGWPLTVKTATVLVIGYGVFALSAFVRQLSQTHLPFEMLLEPLFICMVAGFLVTNHSRHRGEFALLLHEAGPAVYTVFFTLAGASLGLAVLAQTWKLALVLVGVRLLGIMIGSLVGGHLAGLPARATRVSWMAFVTQAGVGLGLAKEVAVEFPEWGYPFATVMIAVIVVNQLVGPPLYKLALTRVGEAHPRGRHAPVTGEHRALIFGLEDQALALARHLQQHGWSATVASRRAGGLGEATANVDLDIRSYDEIAPDALRELGGERADAIVCLLSDDENLRICELAYESYGTDTLVVRLHDRSRAERFTELGALIVDPTTALVSLLDHLVRSPVATSLLLGLDPDQDVVDLEVRNPELHGVALRDLALPLDSLVLSVRRGGRLLISHGFTRLETGDRVSVLVGSRDSLDALQLRIEG